MVFAAATAVAKSGFLATPFVGALSLGVSDADAGFFFMQLGFVGDGRVFAGTKHRPPLRREQIKFLAPRNFNVGTFLPFIAQS
jgi:hypothetical protein